MALSLKCAFSNRARNARRYVLFNAGVSSLTAAMSSVTAGVTRVSSSWRELLPTNATATIAVRIQLSRIHRRVSV